MKPFRPANQLQALDPAPGLRRILATRERELLELKGPCSNKTCRLHYAHSGPCDTTAENGDTDE